MTENKYRILFVCMGNICRSPTAEGLLIHKVNVDDSADRFEIDSCGTHDYHVGNSPDSRSQEVAALRGIDLSYLKSRKIKQSDFDYYDLILVMDKLNQEHLENYCPKEYRHKIKLILEYLPDQNLEEVPDPYYGGDQGFEEVFDILEEAIEAVYEDIC
ncbi:low molecular weight phosphotyrosine protein phosphatase [Gammaproteobacteria bacterium]|nr:low molecular weight phosphotyrosine protein phosphatase [Gammaproteobacteria bacterium]